MKNEKRDHRERRLFLSRKNLGRRMRDDYFQALSAELGIVPDDGNLLDLAASDELHRRFTAMTKPVVARGDKSAIEVPRDVLGRWLKDFFVRNPGEVFLFSDFSEYCGAYRVRGSDLIVDANHLDAFVDFQCCDAGANNGLLCDCQFDLMLDAYLVFAWGDRWGTTLRQSCNSDG